MSRDLFAAAATQRLRKQAPLAVRLRPRTLKEIVGQDHLLAEGRPLRVLLMADRLSSVILWGPPGSGKTTLARVVALTTAKAFVELSAVNATVKDVRAVIAAARDRLGAHGAGTILFLDEVHRFNKAQQDALLPAVEDGLIVLIGATTENPHFEVNPPLMSRSTLFRLHPLDDAALTTLVKRGLAAEGATADKDAVEHLVARSGGDGRHVLTSTEVAIALATERSRGYPDDAAPAPAGDQRHSGGRSVGAGQRHSDGQSAGSGHGPGGERHGGGRSAGGHGHGDGESAGGHGQRRGYGQHHRGGESAGVSGLPVSQSASAHVSLADAEAACDVKAVRYGRDGHYDIISAFIKSIRGSDADAGLYWLARMLQAGEDPRFIARRLVILASEDIGLADDGALVMAEAAARAVEFVGLPEAQLNLAHAVVRLATAPKSNRVTVALGRALADARAVGAGSVPMHLRDAHYRGAKTLGHGKGYRYPHDAAEGWVPQQYRPPEVAENVYYEPSIHGAEGSLSERWPRSQTAAGKLGPDADELDV